MDERSLILNAIKNKDAVTSSDVTFPGEDAILDLVKKRKRRESFKKKPCTQWNNADFLRYIDYTMREFGVARFTGNVRRDSDLINHLYDNFAKKIRDQMNNCVLRDYIDWWSSIWAPRLTGRGFYVQNLMDQSSIQRFLSRFDTPTPIVANTSPNVSSNEDHAIYDLGGLPLLVVKRGLVIGYSVIQKRSTEPQRDLECVVKDLSKSMLTKVLRLTLHNGPYLQSNEFDFMSLASPFLVKWEIKEFSDVDFKDYFKRATEIND